VKGKPLGRRLRVGTAFLLLLSFLFLLFATGLAIAPQGNQTAVFFKKTGDYMADFVQVARYSAGFDPYRSPVGYAQEKAYLPISYLIMGGVSALLGGVSAEAEPAAADGAVLWAAVLFMALCAALLFVQLYALKKGTRPVRLATTVLLFLSGIFLFSFERGNLILLAAAATAFFLANYRAQNRAVRELAFLALAFAAALKGYPALLGLLLLYERRYRDALATALYGVVLAFLPFLFLKGGFANVIPWLADVRLNGIAYDHGVFQRFGPRFLLNALENKGAISPSLRDGIVQGLSVLTALLALLGVWTDRFQTTVWKRIGLLVCILVLLPSNSALYTGLYFLPVVVLFLDAEPRAPRDFLYLALFVCLLCPFQFFVGRTDLTPLLVNFSAEGLFLALSFECAAAWISRIKAGGAPPALEASRAGPVS